MMRKSSQMGVRMPILVSVTSSVTKRKMRIRLYRGSRCRKLTGTQHVVQGSDTVSTQTGSFNTAFTENKGEKDIPYTRALCHPI